MASIFSRFFGRTVSEAAGVAAGIAVASPLRPVVQLVENETWALHPDKPVPAPLAAAIVAEDVERQAWGEEQASFTGFSADSFDAMLGEALNAPGIGELFQMWRRGLIGDAEFTHGLRKAKLEPRWDGPLEGLHDTLLSSEELANLQQQGFIPPARADAEGGLQGVTPERQQLRFEAAGLPPGWAEGLAMLRRGIITEAEFAEIVRTGHTKTKWTGPLLQLRNVVLGAATYAGLALRGWITPAEMHAGGALTGYTPEQMDLLYKEHGRPATARQVFIGLRRGGSYNGPTTGIDQAFIDAIRQSNIRPEWTNLLWAQRFTYPSAFVLRALTQGGDLTQAETEQILLYEGWEPALAKTVSTKWGGGTVAGADPHVGRAQTHLWTTTHASYRDDETGEAQARTALTTLGIDQAAQDQIIALWNAEKALIRRELSPADLRKAFQKQDVNVATGLAWTRADAVARLIELGYDSEDAENYLNIG